MHLIRPKRPKQNSSAFSKKAKSLNGTMPPFPISTPATSIDTRVAWQVIPQIMSEATKQNPISMKPKVSLVLSSGGARGYAHIGAIEELLQRGYTIEAVAGTSMGALVGGMFVAGKLEEVKKWMCSIDRKEMLALIDWSLGLDHVVKGDKVIKALREMVPDVKIEELPISFCAVSADLATKREVVFRKGSLYRAIRASISIPSVFKPVRIAHHQLVDGGIANALPLNRVERKAGSLLVSVNVSAPSTDEAARQHAEEEADDKKQSSWLDHIVPNGLKQRMGRNYVSLLTEAFGMMIERSTVAAQKLNKPDVAVNIPMNRFGAFDFDKADSIIAEGRRCMAQALDEYERCAVSSSGNILPL